MSRIWNKLLSLCFWLCIIGVLCVSVQVFCFASFKIPTDSMEPVLKEGDNILVNKMLYGARLFNIYDALNNRDVKIRRIPGLAAIKRNDVLVFNFPYPAGWDSIGFNIMSYYVKRCVALPGDTLRICNGFYQVNGVSDTLGNYESQRYLSTIQSDAPYGIEMHAFPWDGQLGWTIKDFGPLFVPGKNKQVEMDRSTYLFYRRLIAWEQNTEVTLKENDVYLGDSLITSYQFRKNYYFVAGDRTENSQDSRYWGLLPEEYIVGRATHIWKSRDPVTDKIRWKRVFKKIK